MQFSPELVWFLIGLALILSEFMIPGIILVFFGAGAWITAIASWLGWTSGLPSQLLTFAASSIILLVLLRRWFRNRFIGYVGDDNDLGSNLDEFTGQIVTVTEDIDSLGNKGGVEFKGARWKARSTCRIPSGQRAVIVGMEGISLIVQPENPNEES